MTSEIPFSVPSPIDFEASFGCDCSIDDDLVQTCVFQDKLGRTAHVTFGLIEGSFGLSVIQRETEVIKIYDEFLEYALIREVHQTIEIKLRKDMHTTIVNLCVWPEITFSMLSMKGVTTLQLEDLVFATRKPRRLD